MSTGVIFSLVRVPVIASWPSISATAAKPPDKQNLRFLPTADYVLWLSVSFSPDRHPSIAIISNNQYICVNDKVEYTGR